MLTINIPNNFKEERTYIIDVLFGEYLGLEYNIKTQETTKEYSIILDNKKSLIIEDHFFGKLEAEYLDKKNIPEKTETYHINEFDQKIEILYGKKRVEVSGNKINIGCDIFASAFFMLTRWEEIVIDKKDKHGRFLSSASIAIKNNFIERPIVNEYVEFLWKSLLHLNYSGKRKERTFTFYNTHDVDIPYMFGSLLDCIKVPLYSLFVKKNLSEFGERLVLSVKKIFLNKDPYDTFDYLMDLSEDKKIKSYFFFSASAEGQWENKYGLSEKKIQQLIQKIKNRKHNIGFHPSYAASENAEIFKSELHELKTATQSDIKYGRQHFLRFSNPTTWNLWNDNQLTWESTLTYADRLGFRCGSCFAFSTFDCIARKKLYVKERPLTIMDVTLEQYLDLDAKKAEVASIELIETVKKYKGDFVLLWHNSSFGIPKWKPYKKVFESILAKATENNS